MKAGAFQRDDTKKTENDLLIAGSSSECKTPEIWESAGSMARSRQALRNVEMARIRMCVNRNGLVRHGQGALPRGKMRFLGQSETKEADSR